MLCGRGFRSALGNSLNVDNKLIYVPSVLSMLRCYSLYFKYFFSFYHLECSVRACIWTCLQFIFVWCLSIMNRFWLDFFRAYLCEYCSAYWSVHIAQCCSDMIVCVDVFVGVCDRIKRELLDKILLQLLVKFHWSTFNRRPYLFV